MACCNGSEAKLSQDAQAEALTLEFLFLDESLCQPCGGTGRALDEAVEIVAAPLAALGVALDVTRIHVARREDAIAHRLALSPTIRINGVDIDPDQSEGACGSCGDLAGGQTTVTCRTWRWRGALFSAAPTGKIVEAILSAATPHCAVGCCADPAPQGPYAMPDNLERFFAARQAGDRLCC